MALDRISGSHSLTKPKFMTYNPADPAHRKTIEAQINKLANELNICSKAYNAKKLRCTMLVSGTNADGSTFNHILDITAGKEDCDLIKFFNDFGASAAARKILLQAELSKAVETFVPTE